MGKDVVIACDFNIRQKSLRFLRSSGREAVPVKIGMELFCGRTGHRAFIKGWDTRSSLI